MGENVSGNSGANLLVHFVGGGLSGITSASATYPLDLVRTRLAAQVTRNFWVENHQREILLKPLVECMSDLAVFYIVFIVYLSWIPFIMIFCLLFTLYTETYILFLCREVPCTTGASHMLSVPSVETKVFWVCIRDLEQHCWYVHNAFSLFYLYLPMFLLLTSVIPNHFVCCRVLGPVLLLVLLFMSGYALYGSHKGEFIYLCKV